MKFVAAKSFHNAPELGLKLADTIDNFVHPLQVPKGHRFSIAPSAESLKGVTNLAEKELISKLVLFDLAIVDDGTPSAKDAITKIDKEVKEENAANKAAEANRPLSIGEQIALGVAAALKELGITGKQTAPDPKK